MTRRRQNLFEDLLDITSKFPWWVGVVLAAVAYLILHSFAVMEVTPAAGIKDVGGMMVKQVIKALAMFGQFLLPITFLGGAVVSVFVRQNRNSLHAQVANAEVKDTLEKMTWREFEQLVGEHFRRRGFGVEETGGGRADGGVDLILSRGSDRYFVQCKQWKARRVGVETVRELYGVMAAKGAAGGYVVTSGVFTDEAKRFAEGREIELIEGDRLFEMIRDAQQASTPPGKRIDAPTTPTCPQCSSAMVLRTARKGSNAGSAFWGCPQYPKCRGTRPA